MFDLVGKLRWAHVRDAAFPEAWRAMVRRNVPDVARLSDDERRELEGHVAVFLEAKRFEGAGGLVVTDEMRVTIAAQACLLVLGRCEGEPYPDLVTVVVYPRAYVAKVVRGDGGVVVEGREVRLGESWGQGTVVLAWDAVLSGAAAPHDGHNVVLHEFAHQLDQEDGASDGTPDLPFLRYAAWARVLGAAYQGLVEADAEGRRTVLDRYGATNAGEFFAVATEAFFEKPRALRQRHPELYAELAAYYGRDPAER
jgi:hypothetical protein